MGVRLYLIFEKVEQLRRPRLDLLKWVFPGMGGNTDHKGKPLKLRNQDFSCPYTNFVESQGLGSGFILQGCRV